MNPTAFEGWTGPDREPTAVLNAEQINGTWRGSTASFTLVSKQGVTGVITGRIAQVIHRADGETWLMMGKCEPYERYRLADGDRVELWAEGEL